MRARKEHVTHPDRSLRFLRFELAAFELPRHAHHHVELTWIEQGHGLRLVGDSAEPFESDDLILLGPGVSHTWLTQGARQVPMPRSTVVQFAPELLSDSASPELRRAADLLHAARRGIRLGGTLAARVRQVLVEMRADDPFVRLAGLVLIVGHLLAAPPRERRAIAATGSTPDDSEQRRRADRVIDWMQANLAAELRVDEAARLAHVSPAAFSRWFRREVGKTFTQYLNDLRFSAACSALRQSQRPIGAIATDCGYATLSHFNRQFLRRAGISPRAYRGGA